MSLKQKAKNVETSPSMISEDYVHAFFHCACCGKKFGEADYRREDIEEMQKHSKPLCKNCAKFLSEWQAKNDKEFSELKQKLQQLKDLFSCFIEHIPKHERDVNASYANFIWEIDKKFEELLKEEKESLTIAEKDDVKAGLKEIKEGRSKKFKNVNDLLKELKEKEAKP